MAKDPKPEDEPTPELEQLEEDIQAARRQVEAELANAQATWIARRYHRRPTLAATAFDILAGIADGLRQGGEVGLVHARSTVPAAMAAVTARLLLQLSARGRDRAPERVAT